MATSVQVPEDVKNQVLASREEIKNTANQLRAPSVQFSGGLQRAASQVPNRLDTFTQLQAIEGQKERALETLEQQRMAFEQSVAKNAPEIGEAEFVDQEAKAALEIINSKLSDYDRRIQDQRDDIEWAKKDRDRERLKREKDELEVLQEEKKAWEQALSSDRETMITGLSSGYFKDLAKSFGRKEQMQNERSSQVKELKDQISKSSNLVPIYSESGKLVGTFDSSDPNNPSYLQNKISQNNSITTKDLDYVQRQLEWYSKDKSGISETSMRAILPAGSTASEGGYFLDKNNMTSVSSGIDLQKANPERYQFVASQSDIRNNTLWTDPRLPNVTFGKSVVSGPESITLTTKQMNTLINPPSSQSLNIRDYIQDGKLQIAPKYQYWTTPSKAGAMETIQEKYAPVSIATDKIKIEGKELIVQPINREGGLKQYQSSPVIVPFLKSAYDKVSAMSIGAIKSARYLPENKGLNEIEIAKTGVNGIVSLGGLAVTSAAPSILDRNKEILTVLGKTASTGKDVARTVVSKISDAGEFTYGKVLPKIASPMNFGLSAVGDGAGILDERLNIAVPSTFETNQEIFRRIKAGGAAISQGSRATYNVLQPSIDNPFALAQKTNLLRYDQISTTITDSLPIEQITRSQIINEPLQNLGDFGKSRIDYVKDVFSSDISPAAKLGLGVGKSVWEFTTKTAPMTLFGPSSDGQFVQTPRWFQKDKAINTGVYPYLSGKVSRIIKKAEQSSFISGEPRYNPYTKEYYRQSYEQSLLSPDYPSNIVKVTDPTDKVALLKELDVAEKKGQEGFKTSLKIGEDTLTVAATVYKPAAIGLAAIKIPKAINEAIDFGPKESFKRNKEALAALVIGSAGRSLSFPGKTVQGAAVKVLGPASRSYLGSSLTDTGTGLSRQASDKIEVFSQGLEQDTWSNAPFKAASVITKQALPTSFGKAALNVGALKLFSAGSLYAPKSTMVATSGLGAYQFKTAETKDEALLGLATASLGTYGAYKTIKFDLQAVKPIRVIIPRSKAKDIVKSIRSGQVGINKVDIKKAVMIDDNDKGKSLIVFGKSKSQGLLSSEGSRTYTFRNWQLKLKKLSDATKLFNYTPRPVYAGNYRGGEVRLNDKLFSYTSKEAAEGYSASLKSLIEQGASRSKAVAVLRNIAPSVKTVKLNSAFSAQFGLSKENDNFVKFEGTESITPLKGKVRINKVIDSEYGLRVKDSISLGGKASRYNVEQYMFEQPPAMASKNGLKQASDQTSTLGKTKSYSSIKRITGPRGGERYVRENLETKSIEEDIMKIGNFGKTYSELRSVYQKNPIITGDPLVKDSKVFVSKSKVVQRSISRDLKKIDDSLLASDEIDVLSTKAVIQNSKNIVQGGGPIKDVYVIGRGGSGKVYYDGDGNLKLMTAENFDEVDLLTLKGYTTKAKAVLNLRDKLQLRNLPKMKLDDVRRWGTVSKETGGIVNTKKPSYLNTKKVNQKAKRKGRSPDKPFAWMADTPKPVQTTPVDQTSSSDTVILKPAGDTGSASSSISTSTSKDSSSISVVQSKVNSLRNMPIASTYLPKQARIPSPAKLSSSNTITPTLYPLSSAALLESNQIKTFDTTFNNLSMRQVTDVRQDLFIDNNYVEDTQTRVNESTDLAIQPDLQPSLQPSLQPVLQPVLQPALEPVTDLSLQLTPTVQITPTTTTTLIRPPLTPIRPNIKNTTEPKNRPKVKVVKGYQSFVRKRGKYVQVSPFPLSSEEALKLGIKEALRTPAATVKIVPTSKRARSLGIGAPSASELALFRPPKRSSKLGELTIVQKERQRIITPGEKKGITYTGISAAARKKRGTIFINGRASLNKTMKGGKPKWL